MYTARGLKIGVLVRRLRKFFIWSERPLYEYKARAKTKNLLQGQRNQIPIFKPRTVYQLLFAFFIFIGMNSATARAKVSKRDDSFLEFLSNHIPLTADNRIYIPENIKHIKLDIGLSYNAPFSQLWLSQEEDLFVIGFEPNPASVDSIRTGAVKLNPFHGEPLNIKYLNTHFYLIPCALGRSKAKTTPFYVSNDDPGTSSIYRPKYLGVEKIIDVPIFPLTDFFFLFPFDKHPLIEYIKIDAQGADLNIVRSAGHYLQDHVIYITLEAEDHQYQNTINSEEHIEIYMRTIGFERHYSKDVEDPTYVNLRFKEYAQMHAIKIVQKID